jgi:hypothetical protein
MVKVKHIREVDYFVLRRLEFDITHVNDQHSISCIPSTHNFCLTILLDMTLSGS